MSLPTKAEELNYYSFAQISCLIILNYRLVGETRLGSSGDKRSKQKMKLVAVTCCLASQIIGQTISSLGEGRVPGITFTVHLHSGKKQAPEQHRSRSEPILPHNIQAHAVQHTSPHSSTHKPTHFNTQTHTEEEYKL